MNIKVIEEKDDMLKIEIDDTTLINLLNENVWKQQGVKSSTYKIAHPYLAQPVITVRSKNPKKTLIDAADQIVDDVTTLKKKFQTALK